MHEHRICVWTYSSAGTNAQNHANAYVRTYGDMYTCARASSSIATHLTVTCAFPPCLALQLQLMEDHVKALQRTIKPGAKRLNWSSLGIQDYVTKCEEALTKFESLSNQVLKNAKDIEERLQSIESACLYKDPFVDGGLDGKRMEAKVRQFMCVCHTS